MKIIVIKPIDTGIYKDDTSMFIEGFKKLGHDVIPLYAVSNTELHVPASMKKEDMDNFNPDIIWAPYEPLIPAAFEISKIYGGEVVGHFEILPHRISLDEIEKALRKGTEHPNEEIYIRYKLYCKKWNECKVKTVTEQLSFYNLEKILGITLTELPLVKPYPLDTEMLDSFKEDVEKKHQIMSVHRLVDTKRAHHVITALSLIENPPKYVILGDGPERKRLEMLAKNLNVDVEFKSTVSDIEKIRTIKESLFSVCLWAWLPIGESAYLETPSIAYAYRETINRLGDIPVYTPINDIKKLAETIEYLIKNEEFRKTFGKDAKRKIIEKKCYTLPLMDAAQIMVEYFEEALKK